MLHPMETAETHEKENSEYEEDDDELSSNEKKNIFSIYYVQY